MAIKKIPCGGFRYDDETVEFEDGVMKAKGGGSDGGAMFVTVTFHESVNDGTADKTVDEIIAAVLAGKEVKAKVLMADEPVGVLNFSALLDGNLTFGGFQYSPSKDGNYPMLAGLIDDNVDVWIIDA